MINKLWITTINQAHCFMNLDKWIPLNHETYIVNTCVYTQLGKTIGQKSKNKELEKKTCFFLSFFWVDFTDKFYTETQRCPDCKIKPLQPESSILFFVILAKFQPPIYLTNEKVYTCTKMFWTPLLHHYFIRP